MHNDSQGCTRRWISKIEFHSPGAHGLPGEKEGVHSVGGSSVPGGRVLRSTDGMANKWQIPGGGFWKCPHLVG